MNVLIRKKELVKKLYQNKILVTQEIIKLFDNSEFLNSVLVLDSENFSTQFPALLASFNNSNSNIYIVVVIIIIVIILKIPETIKIIS